VCACCPPKPLPCAPDADEAGRGRPSCTSAAGVAGCEIWSWDDMDEDGSETTERGTGGGGAHRLEVEARLAVGGDAEEGVSPWSAWVWARAWASIWLQAATNWSRIW
jgi:hypothetical protein